MGVLDVDEIRDLEDLNPLPGGIGEKRFVPMNFTTLENAGDETDGSQSPPSTPPPPDDDLAARHADALGKLVEFVADAGEHLEGMRCIHGQDLAERDTARNHEQREACRAVVAETYARMLAKESEFVRRQGVKGTKGNIVRELDAYYDAFGPKLLEYMRSPLRAWDSSVDAARVVELHIARSKNELLKSLECQPDEVSGRIDATLTRWKTRTINEVLQ
jgi:hypothetical protein